MDIKDKLDRIIEMCGKDHSKDKKKKKKVEKEK
jgi:hypothetical protein